MAVIQAEHIALAVSKVRAVASMPGPIVVGPWLGEVGFELLYWIPFLRWVVGAVGLERDRMIVVSRGGCQAWYGDLAGSYRDIFTTMAPRELKALNRERMDEQATAGTAFGIRLGRDTSKQFGITRAEREVLCRVGVGGLPVLHPSVMYHLFRLFWRQRCPDLYARCARPKQLRRKASTDPYVAVKFYRSMACADRTETAAAVRQIVRVLADTMRVVVLESGDQYDEHGPIDVTGQVTTIRPDPVTNLSVQTDVIAGASAFVGTYGGFAYLAPFLGVPATAYYSDRNFRDDHYHVIGSLCRKWHVRFDLQDLLAQRRHRAA